MDESLGCSTRSMAIAGLVTYGVTAILIELTLHYPRFGEPPITPGHGESFRLPPLGLLIFMFGVFTIGVAALIGSVCLRYSIENRRWAWIPVFPLCMIAALQGPAFLFIQPRFNPTMWNVVGLISALGVLLTLLATLLCSRRSPSA